MIQPLRTWHRRAFTALAVALPAIFAAAISVRPAESPALPPPAPAGAIVDDSASDWRAYPISTRIRTIAGGRALELQPRAEILEPDVLVYLAPAPPGQALPDNARLLGTLGRGATYPLPPTITPGSTLILYSAARRRVLDTAPLRVGP